MIGRIDPAATTRDAAAFAAWLDTQDAVDKRRKIGAQGYCMGGPFAVRTAAAKREADIAVFPADHGWCVPDSPVYDKAQADRAWDALLALYAKL